MHRAYHAHSERIRDVLSGPFSPEEIKQPTTAGLADGVDQWRRELPDPEAPTEGAFGEDIPYGLRISITASEEATDQNQALTLTMDLPGQDFSYSHIVSNLNEKGFRTREGKPWNRVNQ